MLHTSVLFASSQNFDFVLTHSAQDDSLIWLPPGGGSRRRRVEESACRRTLYKPKFSRAPSVTDKPCHLLVATRVTKVCGANWRENDYQSFSNTLTPLRYLPEGGLRTVGTPVPTRCRAAGETVCPYIPSQSATLPPLTSGAAMMEHA